MKHPVPVWARLGGLLCLSLPLPALARAPAAVKAVPLGDKDLAALHLEDTLGSSCERLQVNGPRQDFRIQQKDSPLDGVLFVGVECLDGAGNVRFGLFRDGRLAQTLPRHPANQWSPYEVEAVSFPDIDGDGRFDIVTIVSAMTGAGPTGAVPFSVAEAWFQKADGTFEADPRTEEVLDKVRKPTVKTVVAALKKARVHQP